MAARKRTSTTKATKRTTDKPNTAAVNEWGRVTGDLMARHNIGQAEADAMLLDGIRQAGEAEAAGEPAPGTV